MNKFKIGIIFSVCFIVGLGAAQNEKQSSASEVTTAADLVSKIYAECSTLSCAKPKLLSFFSASLNKNKIRITRDLSIVRNSESAEPSAEDEIYNQQISNLSEDKKEALRSLMLDKLDDFIASHELRMRVPKEIVSAPVARFVPEFLMKNIPSEIKMPLIGSQVGQERGFVKKVIIPFLLGLKFKATALLPLALALIALKTWKALTLGLLSLVLSGALLMFRFATKPKILSYEVVHHAPPVIHSAPIAPHYIDHHDHIHDHHAYDHPPFNKRSLDYLNNSPYRGQEQSR